MTILLKVEFTARLMHLQIVVFKIKQDKVQNQEELLYSKQQPQ